MNLNSSAILLLAIALSACVPAQPTTGGMATQENTVGPGPKPIHSRATVLKYLDSTLRDPDSLKDFSISEPRLGKMYGGVFNGFKKDPGWYVCFTYNAKNAYGGYTGSSTYVQWFRNDQLATRPGYDSPAPISVSVANPYDEFSCN